MINTNRVERFVRQTKFRDDLAVLVILGDLGVAQAYGG
jgi:hypothetical protein